MSVLRSTTWVAFMVDPGKVAALPFHSPTVFGALYCLPEALLSFRTNSTFHPHHGSTRFGIAVSQQHVEQGMTLQAKGVRMEHWQRMTWLSRNETYLKKVHSDPTNRTGGNARG